MSDASSAGLLLLHVLLPHLHHHDCRCSGALIGLLWTVQSDILTNLQLLLFAEGLVCRGLCWV